MIRNRISFYQIPGIICRDHWRCRARLIYISVYMDSGKACTLSSWLLSGGIVPCPGALVILLLAVALHRIAFGSLLILSFSIGPAAVLITIGTLMVKARPIMERFSGEGRFIQRLPLVSSVVIILAGLVIGVRSLVEAGIVVINL